MTFNFIRAHYIYILVRWQMLRTKRFTLYDVQIFQEGTKLIDSERDVREMKPATMRQE